MRILGTTYYGTRHITTTQKEVRSPADMVGFKLRVPENDVFKAMAEAWGAQPTPMNFGELYLALKQNVVDGQENPLPTIKSGKFDEVQKYLVLSGHIITPRLVVVNEAFWQGLTPGDRMIIADAVKAGIAWQDAELIKQEGSLVDTFKAAGMTVITPDPKAFRDPVAREGAEDVRVEVGRGHVRADPGDPLAHGRGSDDRCPGRPPLRRRSDAMTARPPIVDRLVDLAAIAAFTGMFGCVLAQVVLPLRPAATRSSGATSSRATCSSGRRSSAGSSPRAGAAHLAIGMLVERQLPPRAATACRVVRGARDGVAFAARARRGTAGASRCATSTSRRRRCFFAMGVVYAIVPLAAIAVGALRAGRRAHGVARRRRGARRGAPP